MLKDRIKIKDRNKTEMSERIVLIFLSHGHFGPLTLRTNAPSDQCTGIGELKPGGVYYLSTYTKLYSEIGLNYSICNLDR